MTKNEEQQLQEDLDLINNPSILMPKLYSFEHVRKLLALFKKNLDNQWVEKSREEYKRGWIDGAGNSDLLLEKSTDFFNEIEKFKKKRNEKN